LVCIFNRLIHPSPGARLPCFVNQCNLVIGYINDYIYRSGNLKFISDIACVFEQGIYFPDIIPGEPGEIKVVQGFPEILPPSQYGQTAQSRLEAFEHQKLEYLSVVMNCNAPFVIVIFDEKRIVRRPCASLLEGFFSVRIQVGSLSNARLGNDFFPLAVLILFRSATSRSSSLETLTIHKPICLLIRRDAKTIDNFSNPISS